MPDPDYVFRYPLGCLSDSAAPDLHDLPAKHLRALLDILSPTWKGEDVRIDGFSLPCDPNLFHPLYPEEEDCPRETHDRLDIYEPRLRYIRTLLESLLAIVDLECGGKSVRVDAFRLKRPDHWLRPGGGAADILAHAATDCNLNCRFCYNQGAPPVFAPAPRKKEADFREIRTRIAHYVPGSKMGLFPDMGSPCEMLAHDRIRDILAALRKKTREVIRIPTNGSTLTSGVINELSKFAPLFIDISLNSSSPERRRWLMRDFEPEIALRSLANLQSAHIPYSVVIVPWPFPSVEEMIADLRRTVAFSARFDPAFIQISLPGYSRFFSEQPLFDRETVWTLLKTTVQELRAGVDCPLILRPGLFEEYLDPQAVDTAQVEGVIKHSPADRAGVRRGDRLRSLNGLTVRNRPVARSLLSTIHGGLPGRVPLTVERKGVEVDLLMDLDDFDYPFDPSLSTYTGIVFPSAGIPFTWPEELRHLIRARGAREVLLFTSTLVRPTLEKRLREGLFLPGVKLHVRVPPNRYMGGNIFMGDLLVVEDYISAAEDFLNEAERRPELIVIPSSAFRLSGWGRDLTGRFYKEIERHLRIPVALLDCAPIFD